MMSLGDFFSSAAHARPINPREIKFTVVAKGDVLPNGDHNVHQVPVGARVVAGLVFIGGDGNEQARLSGRKAILDRGTDKKTGISFYSDEDVNVEIGYQQIFRAVMQWDSKERKVGSRFFDSVEQARELVELSEASRILVAYNKYVADEHPSDPDASGKVEGVDQTTFRGSKAAG